MDHVSSVESNQLDVPHNSSDEMIGRYLINVITSYNEASLIIECGMVTTSQDPSTDAHVTRTNTKCTSSSCLSVAKRQRPHKREQDKMAALKYRNCKKEEMLTLYKQQTKLEQENNELVDKVKTAEQEILILKSLIREIYGPCNHGNPTTKTISQSNNLLVAVNTTTSSLQ